MISGWRCLRRRATFSPPAVLSSRSRNRSTWVRSTSATDAGCDSPLLVRGVDGRVLRRRRCSRLAGREVTDRLATLGHGLVFGLMAFYCLAVWGIVAYLVYSVGG
jgi:hypothetical protein